MSARIAVQAPVRPALQKLRKGGRHPLTREAVAASQRARILEAVALAVAEKGYAATIVTDVVARAGVSRRTFYEQFPDLESCFLAAYEAGRERLMRRIRDAVARLPEADWRGRARESLRAYLEGLAAEPAAAWAFTIEAMGAGPKALEGRAAILGHWVGQWRALQKIARREDPAIKPADDARLLALVGGIEELVRDCLRKGEPQQLTKLTETATDIAIAVIGR